MLSNIKVVIIAAVVISIFLLIALFLNIGGNQQPIASPPPVISPNTLTPKGGPPIIFDVKVSESTFSAYLNTEVGKTTKEEVEKIPNRVKKRVINEGVEEYTFSSPYDLRKNAVITKDNTVVFKRSVTIDPVTSITPKIEDYLKLYGEPENQYTDSASFGRFIKTYVYPSKGVAIIFNPTTSEVYEVQQFLPTSIDEYLEVYGDDINNFVDNENI